MSIWAFRRIKARGGAHDVSQWTPKRIGTLTLEDGAKLLGANFTTISHG